MFFYRPTFHELHTSSYITSAIGTHVRIGRAWGTYTPPFFINKKGEKKGMHLLRWAHSSSPRPLLQNPSPGPLSWIRPWSIMVITTYAVGIDLPSYFRAGVTVSLHGSIAIGPERGCKPDRSCGLLFVLDLPVLHWKVTQVCKIKLLLHEQVFLEKFPWPVMCWCTLPTISLLSCLVHS